MNPTTSTLPPAAAPEQNVPAWKLVGTLTLAGALAGFLIVVVFQWAEPRILQHQARAVAAAIDEVLGAPARTRTLFMWNNTLTASPPAGQDTVALDRVWAGYTTNDQLIGYALIAAEPGFQDVIRLMFGYDPVQHRVLGMRVLDNKETPGLGDKIVKDSAFVAQFAAAVAPMLAIKPGTGTGDHTEVQTITGATISSRAVIGIINRRIDQVAPLLAAVKQP